MIIPVVLLAACKVDTTIDLYTTDLLEIQSADELSTPSIIRIEVSSCEDNKGRVMEIAQKYFDVSSAAACISKGMEDFVEFSAQSPIVHNNDYLPRNLVAGILVQSNGENGRQVYMIVDQTRFSALENDVRDMDTTASLELNDIVINLNHDGREVTSVYIPSAFADNQPLIASTLDINRRESIKIALSNVGVAELVISGKTLAFELE